MTLCLIERGQPINSHQETHHASIRHRQLKAIARIVALSLMADGAIDLSEVESMQRNKIISSLGLSNPLFDKVTHEFCEDMLTFANRTPAGQYELDPEKH